jgi:hypothetical protein
MTLLVRDEEDVLAANLDFHFAQGVDFVIATDNLSVDRSPEILRSYERRGVLRYIHEPADDYNQFLWVTRMARLAACEHGADWVINNDADEFWWPRRGTLRDVLAVVPAAFGVVEAQRHNFVPVEGGEPFHARMIWRETISLNSLGQPLPTKVAHRAAAGVLVAQGNHAVDGVAPPAVMPADIEILHFPIRQRAQFTNKIAKGGAAYARNPTLPPGVGGTWRRLYSEMQSGGGLNRHLDAAMHGPEQLARRLAAGEIVEDRRLADFFRLHSQGTAVARDSRGDGNHDHLVEDEASLERTADVLERSEVAHKRAIRRD